MTSRVKKLVEATWLIAFWTRGLWSPGRPSPLPLLELFVGLLDDHDGGVAEGPDGDGDAAKGHDIGGQTHPLEGDEGDQHR